MADNQTKIVITAEANQAEGALRTLGQSVDGVTRQFFSLSGAAGTLGGALTLTAFAGFIKSAADAQEELLKLSRIAGTTVGEMSGLKFAAEQNGTSVETLAKAIKHLGGTMVDKPDLFTRFGVTAKDSTGALLQLSDIIAGMPDGIEKTALLGKLMGERFGPELVEFMSQGGAALRETIEKGKALIPVSEENALQSKLFNDQLDELKTRASGAGMSIANELMPSMNSLLQVFGEFQKNGGKDLRVTWLDDFVRDLAISSARAEIVAEEFLQKITFGKIAERHRQAAEQARADLSRMLGERAMAGYHPGAADSAAPAPSGKAGKQLLGALGDGTGKAAKSGKEWQPGSEDAIIEKAIKQRAALVLRSEEQLSRELERVWDKRYEDQQRLILTGRGMDKGTSEADQYQGQLDALNAYYEQGTLAFESYAQIREDLERQHNDNMIQLAVNGRLSLSQLDELSGSQRFAVAAQWMQKSIGAASQHSRAMFNINKAVSLAQAAIAIPETVMDAYKWGTKFGGPIGGSIAAGVALAAQLVNLNAIKSASFGGAADTISAGGGSVGVGALPGQTTNSSVPATTARSGINVTINLGSDAALLPATAVRALIEQINEQIKDGAAIEGIRVA